MNLWVILLCTVIPFAFAAGSSAMLSQEAVRFPNFILRLTSARRMSKLRSQVRMVVNAVNSGTVTLTDITYDSLEKVNAAVFNAYLYLPEQEDKFDYILTSEKKISAIPRIVSVKRLFELYADIIALGDTMPANMSSYDYQLSPFELQWKSENESLKKDIASWVTKNENRELSSYKAIRKNAKTTVDVEMATNPRRRISERLVRRLG